MTRIDAQTLNELRDQAEFNELKVLTMGPAELLSTLDTDNVTVGQIILIGDLASAYVALKSFRDATQREDTMKSAFGQYLASKVAERRASDGLSMPDAGSPLAGLLAQYDASNGDQAAGSPVSAEESDDFEDLSEDLGGESNDDGDFDDDGDDYEPTDGERAAAQQLLSQIFSGAGVAVPTVNGPVPFDQIPRDASGAPDSAWVDENCTCDAHVQRRASDSVNVAEDVPIGQYV